MDEHIEREKAIELLSEPITMSMCLSMDECHHKIAQRRIDLYLIENIPAADVRPVVRATWIVKEMQALFPGMDEHPVFVCSECGYQIYDLLDSVKERHHYCTNCGAMMEES